MSHAGIRLSDISDHITWSWNDSVGEITTQLAYAAIAQDHYPLAGRWWFSRLWKWKEPLKILCFTWLALSNRLVTGDNYYHRGGMGPTACPLCYQALETVEHLLLNCNFTRQLWHLISGIWEIDFQWSFDSLESALLAWINRQSIHSSFPLYFFWGLWKMRNMILFDDFKLSLQHARSYIIHYVSDAPIQQRQPRLHLLFSPQVDNGRSCGFFDGAAQRGAGGAGGLLIISHLEYYELSFNSGKGSNTRAELLALGGLLFFTRHLNLTNLQVYGDSSAVVNWARGLHSLRVASLGHWLQRIRLLMGMFTNLDFHHTSRQFNQRADILSKKGLRQKEGILNYIHFDGPLHRVEGSIFFY